MLLIKYLKRNRKGIILLAGCAAIFCITAPLYKIPVEAVLYPIFLCMLLAAFFFVSGYYSFKKRYRDIIKLSQNPEAIEEKLPVSKDIIEEELMLLLAALDKDRREKITAADRKAMDQQEYFSLWAHQIKTPISAMDLLLQAGEPEEGELAEQLFKIEEYVGVALQYLRVEAISGDLALTECGLDHIIKQALHKYAGVFIRSRLTLNYEPTGCSVITDEKWLVFVIEQLLSNALKYTKTGSISIYMLTGSEKTLCVEDTGIGITPEDLPRVFENGFTGYNGRLDKKSTGIGLYLCKRVLDKLSYGIKIESRLGRGTRVMLALDLPEIHVE